MSEKQIIETYIGKADWKVKENSNTGYSISGLYLQLSENAVSKYMLEHTYTKPITDAYKSGYFHIHDLGLGNTVYCMGHDLKEVLEQGFNGVRGKVSASAPKHLRTAVNQMVNYLFTTQSECAGAQAFNNVDTLLAPYIKYEKLDYDEVKQCMQEFTYSMNVSNRVGFQAPFSNVTFDLKCPEHFKKIVPKIGGKKVDFTYGDCNDEIGMIAKAFFEVAMDGDAEGKPFTFPIPTVNLHKDFVWDDDVAMTIFEATAKYGTASFQNFINSDLDPEETYSMCCRLRIDKKDLIKNSGGIFGAGVKTGSIGVVTINLPRLAYESETEDEFFEKLYKYMDLAKDSLEIKRDVINTNMEKGLVPYISRYIGTYENHFSTIGIIGGNEMCLNLIGEDITTDKGKELTTRVLANMKQRISEYQEQTGNYYNLEQTPAESTCYKLAMKDREKHPEIITSGCQEVPYYTNSTHYPVDHSKTLFKMLKVQEQFNDYYNGGTIVHTFLGQKVTDWINCMLLVRKIANSTTLPFFTISPTFSICPIHGYISGEHRYCPLDHSDNDLDKYGVFEEVKKNE